MRDLSLDERRRMLFVHLPQALREDYDTQLGWMTANIEMARDALERATRQLAREQYREAEEWVRAAHDVLCAHVLLPQIDLTPEIILPGDKGDEA